MTRRDDHFDAMLRHLGATYYQTLQGQATPSDVAAAVESLERAAADRGRAAGHGGATGPGQDGRRVPRTGRWRVRDVMTADVISVDRRTSGTTIARLMSEHHINAVPVLTGGRKVAGVVSEADLLKNQQRTAGGGRGGLLRRGRPAVSHARTAGELMTSPAITIHPDAPLGAAARRMTGDQLTLLPVVDAAGELIGVVSRRDLLKVYLRPDAEIAAEVSGALADVLFIDPAAVTVTARDGLVTLAGQVERPDVAAVAVRMAAAVDGVLAVVDKLTAAPVTAEQPGS
jgi:CBS domain-containing protein